MCGFFSAQAKQNQSDEEFQGRQIVHAIHSEQLTATALWPVSARRSRGCLGALRVGGPKHETLGARPMSTPWESHFAERPLAGISLGMDAKPSQHSTRALARWGFQLLGPDVLDQRARDFRVERLRRMCLVSAIRHQRGGFADRRESVPDPRRHDNKHIGVWAP